MDTDDMIDLGLGDAMPPSKLDYLKQGLQAIPGAVTAIAGAVRGQPQDAPRDAGPQQPQPQPSALSRALASPAIKYGGLALGAVLLLRALKRK